MIELDIRNVGVYKELKIKTSSTSIDIGLLNKEEREEVGRVCLEAAIDLLDDYDGNCSLFDTVLEELT